MALTGESVPRDVEEGEAVISGCVNLSGVLEVEVKKNYGESTVAKILDLVAYWPLPALQRNQAGY